MRMLGWLEPDESLLKHLDVSRTTFDDTGLAMNRLMGFCKSNAYQKILFFVENNVVVFAMFGFIIGAALESERQDTLEGIQNFLIIINFYSGPGSFFYYQEEYLQVYRSIREDPFDYGETLDESTIENIKQMKARNISAQKRFRKLFSVNMTMILIAQCGKKLVGYLIRGGGRKAVDGINGLIRNGPFGVYFPFAEHWVPYLIGLIFTNQFMVYLCITVVAYTASFQHLSSDLLVEYDILEITFSKAVKRAELLYRRKYGNSKVDNYKELFNDCLEQCMSLSVKHHQQTNRSFEVLKKMMFWPLFVVFGSWAIIVCVSFFLIMGGEADLELLLPLPALIASECVVVGAFCHYGELFKTASDRLGTSIIHGDNATKHLVILKPYISMMMSLSSHPLTLDAAGFAAVDHELLMSLFTTAYSYMGFLLSG